MNKSLSKPKRWLILSILGLVFVLFLGGFSLISQAASGTPQILSVQGRLADGSGNLLGGSGTTFYFKFSIWDDPTSSPITGNQLWPVAAPNSVAATVRQGVFNVNVGDTASGYPDILNYDFNTNENVYLQIEASSDNVTFQTLSPRQRISSGAFAQLSAAVSGTSTPSSFGTTTPIPLSQVSVEATTTSSVALSIRAAAGQTANLFQIQEGVDAINQIVVDSSFRLGVGTTSPFVALSVGGRAYVESLGVGGAATTSAGAITADLLDSRGRLRVAELTNCDTIDTDASGVLRCGNDSTGAGGGISTVQEDDVTVDAAATVLDFLGPDFDVSSGPAGEANVSINYFSTGNLTIDGDANINGSDINIGNGLQATSTLHGQYGKLGFGSTTPYAQVSIEADASIVGSTTPIFSVGDTGSSTLFVIQASGRIGIATSTSYGAESETGAGLSIATSTYIEGGLSIGRSATTTSGGLEAVTGDFSGRLQVRSLVSCDTIDTDGDGVLRCGTDGGGASAVTLQDAYRDSGVDGVISTTDGKNLIFDIEDTTTDANVAITIEDTSGGQFVIQTRNASGAATTTNFVVTRDGRVGIATATPGTGLAVQATTTLLGGPTYIYGQLTLPFLTATSTTNNTFAGALDVTESATSSFTGGLTVTTTGGLSSASGLTVSGGDIVSSGKLTITNVGTSSNSGTFLNSNLLSSGSLFVSGAGTSTVIDNSALIKGTLNVNDLAVTDQATFGGRLEVNGAATSSFAGGVQAVGLNSSQGLTVGTGDSVFGGKITVNGAATNTFVGNISVASLNANDLQVTDQASFGGRLEVNGVSTSSIAAGLTLGSAGLNSATIYNSVGALNVGLSSQNTSLTATQLLATANQYLFSTSTEQPDVPNLATIEATTTLSNVLTLRGFGALNDYAGNLLQLQDSSLNSLAVFTGAGKFGIATSVPGGALAVASTTVFAGNVNIDAAVLDVKSSATSTFDGGLTVTTTGGLSSAQGLTISGGDIVSSGKLNISSTATSSNAGNFLNSGSLNTNDLQVTDQASFGGRLEVNGAATSSFVGGLTAAGLNSSQGLSVTTGDAVFAGKLNITGAASSTNAGGWSVTGAVSANDLSIADQATFGGRLEVNGVATSSFAGGVQAVGLTSSQGLAVTTGDAVFSQKIVVGSGTSTFAGAIVATGGLTGNDLIITDQASFGGRLEVNGVATSSFAGGVQAVGLTSSQGLTVSTGDTILAGKLTVSGTATSTAAGGFTVSGALNANDLQVTDQASFGGRLEVNGVATSSFVGGIQSAGLTSSQGLFVTGADSYFTGNNVGIASTTIRNKLEVGGFAVIKGNLNIDATSTASSFNATSTLSVATSTPTTNTQLAVNGNAYITRGLSVGTSATTTPGSIIASRIQLRDLGNCNGASTIDAIDGFLVCGDDTTSAGAGVSTIQRDDASIESAATTIDFLGSDFLVTSNPAGEANISIRHFNGSNLDLAGDANINGSQLNVGDGTATGTLSVVSGQLGLQAVGTGIGATSTGSIYFKDSSGNIRGRFQTQVLDNGDGADGAVTIAEVEDCTQNDIDDASAATGPTCYAADLGIGLEEELPFSVEAGTNLVRIATTSTGWLLPGDEIMIIQMERGATNTLAVTNASTTPDGAFGYYEFKIVDEVGSGFIIVTTNFENPYIDDDLNNNVQVIRVPNWTSVTVNDGGQLTVSRYGTSTYAAVGGQNVGDGTGGILVFRASGTLDLRAQKSIDVSGKGFLGGYASTSGTGDGGGGMGGAVNDSSTATTSSDGSKGQCGFGPGAGCAGLPGRSGIGGHGGNTGATQGAGGGGGGGGGGYGAPGVYAAGVVAVAAVPGGDGGDGGYGGGAGGPGGSAGEIATATPYMPRDLSRITLGSGGGAGGGGGGAGGGGGSDTAGGNGGDGGPGGRGGNGAGSLMLFANALIVDQTAELAIIANGEAASNGRAGTAGQVGGNAATDGPGGGGGGGGGGAGGSGSAGAIWLKVGTLSFNGGVPNEPWLAATSSLAFGGAGGAGGESDPATDDGGSGGGGGGCPGGAFGIGGSGGAGSEGSPGQVGQTMCAGAAGSPGYIRLDYDSLNSPNRGIITPGPGFLSSNAYGEFHLGSINTVSADVAERFPVKDSSIEPGDVVVISDDIAQAADTLRGTAYVNKSRRPYEQRVLGVVSTEPGVELGKEEFKNQLTRPIAIAGRIPVKVTDEGGPIKPGDYLTTSLSEGYAMKANRSGVAIGKALDYHRRGNGVVMMFVEVGYQQVDWSIELEDITKNIQQGGDWVATSAPNSFLINQKGSGDLLQLQENGVQRLLVGNDGVFELNVRTSEGELEKPLVVIRSNDKEMFTINARGDAVIKGVIRIENDSFAGAVITNENGLADVQFSYHLGTGKPITNLTAEAEDGVVVAQVAKLFSDADGNYTGLRIKASQVPSGQPAPHVMINYTVIAKQAGYVATNTMPIVVVIDLPQEEIIVLPVEEGVASSTSVEIIAPIEFPVEMPAPVDSPAVIEIPVEAPPTEPPVTTMPDPVSAETNPLIPSEPTLAPESVQTTIQ